MDVKLQQFQAQKPKPTNERNYTAIQRSRRNIGKTTERQEKAHEKAGNT